MIEVLVTMVILAFGLLGMAGLQMRLQSSEMESYQRTQAMLLLDDMKSRIESNRLQAALYDERMSLASPVGAGMTCPAVDAASTRVDLDAKEWCDAVQGAGESSGAGKVGSMIGGRGCVEDLGIGPSGEKLFRVSVAWQGLTPISAPSEACGAGAYNGLAGCTADLCRRVVSTVIRMANLK
jgi:type IV pilus assembly protein PilV